MSTKSEKACCCASSTGSPAPRTLAAQPPDRAEVEGLGSAELIERYARGINQFERRLLDLTDAELDTAFRPEAGVGRWSCRMLMGRLADAELVFTHRMRRAVAEENPTLALWDEEAFIDAGLYAGAHGGGDRPIAGSVALIHTIRLWTTDWLRTLDDAAMARLALHPEAGPVTVRSILVGAVWHIEHHAWYLSRKIEKLRGPEAGCCGG